MKKLTLLHSNDMHGDFLPKEKDGRQIGGLARLCGYVNQTRNETDTVFAMAGDMFQGSIIDSEYMGLSTIELINVLRPNVATIGNHEVDYGLAHLLFLEKCARFPIINANLYVKLNNARLFQPHINITCNGIRILFIGILTEEILSVTKKEKIIGTFVDVEDAAREVGIICDNYRTSSTDITVLLTHIGIEKDCELASKLDPKWGVDLIIGGHSHTEMDEPRYVNGIPIVQAGTGTSHIGRFDINYDDENKKIDSLKWEYVEISEDNAPEEPIISELLSRYQQETDVKYHRVVTRLKRKLTHPSRIEETELGNLYADMMQDESSFDIMMFGSGAIRKKELGPVIDYQELMENTPFDDMVWMFEVTGEQFRRMILHIFRDEAWEGHTEFYNYSRGVRIVYRKSTHELEEFKFHGEDIRPDQKLKIAIQNYHFNNFNAFLGIPLEEVRKNMSPRTVMTSVNNIVEEYMSQHPDLDAQVEGRIVILE